ncbi:MAG: hypothetical protein WC829_15970 [Hyphomicrobium sp.]|jgi:hypothetical protein
MAITYTASQIQINSGKDSGTATSGTTTSLVCSSKAWTVDEFIDYVVWIKTGTGAGQSRVIASNTATALVPKNAWATAPSATSTFVILYRISDIVAAVPTYAAWSSADATSRVCNFSAPVRLLSGGALCQERENMIFTTASHYLVTDAGSYFHAGNVASDAFPYNGTEGGAIIGKGPTTGYWELTWKGKVRLYGTVLDIKRRAADSANSAARLNYTAYAISSGVELYDCVIIGIVFQLQAADTVKNTRCFPHNTSSGLDASFGLYGAPVMANNIGSISPRADGSYTINGGDIIDHTSITPATYEMFLYNFMARTGQGVVYLWNLLPSNPWSAIAYWYSDLDADFDEIMDLPDGKIYRGYTVDLAIKNSAAVAIEGASVAVYDVNGDGGILSGKTAAKDPTRIVAVATDASGSYTGVIGTGNGLPIPYAKYMAAAANSVASVETLYAPFTFKVRKYGFKFLQKSSAWSKRSVEDITMDTNAYAIAAEATVAARTGIAFNGASKTTTLTEPHSLQEVYEGGQYWAAQIANVGYDEPTTTVEGNNFNQTTGQTIICDGYLTYSGKRLSGGTLQFNTAGTYAPTVGAITLQFNAVGMFNFGTASFGDTITLVNISGGAVTVSLAAGVSYVNSGPNITVDTPPVYQGLSFAGLVAGSQLKIFTTTTQTVLDSITSSGTTFDWSILYTTDKTIDYTILQDGYIPIRVTGVAVGAAVQAVTVQQVVDNSFIAPAGLTFGTTATVDIATKRFTIGANTTGQNWYSFMVQAWRTEASLQNKAFPLITNGPNSVRLQAGWEISAGLAYWTRDGLAYYDGALTMAYCAMLTSGTEAGHQVRYIQSHDGTMTNAANTGPMDQLVQIYGDATHGNFDRRDYLVLKIQKDGYDQAEVDVVGTYGTLEDQLYVVGLQAVPNGVASDATARALTITDHGASPVTWQSKAWSITITATGLTGTQIMQWLRYSCEQAGSFEGKQTFDWHDLVRVDGSDFKTVRGTLYGDVGAALKGVRVLDGTEPHGDFSVMTADDGTTYVRPVPDIVQSFTVNGLIAGSLVQIYDVTNSVQLALGTSTTSYVWTDTVPAVGSRQIRLRVAYCAGTAAKEFIEIANAGTCGILATNAVKDYTVAQETDPVYGTNAIDGSLVTDISIVDAVDRMQMNIPGGTVSWAQIYAYNVYWLATAAGIVDDGSIITAVDQANYIVTLFKIVNTNTLVPLKITGGYGHDSVTGSIEDILDTTVGSIFPIVDHVVSSVVTVGGVNVITGDIADVPAKVQTGMTSQGYTTTRAVQLDSIGGVAPTEAEIAAAVRLELTGELANMDVAVSSRLATSGYTPASEAGIAVAVRSNLTVELANMDAAVSTRLATAGYVAPTTPPDAASVADAVWLNASRTLTSAGITPADVWTHASRSLTEAAPTAAENAAAVLAAAQAAPIWADAKRMNGAAIAGDGTADDLWRGA